MQLHQIEAWVLSVVERVAHGQPIEDSRLEVKARWPDAIRAARRIAGHANAAHGAPILWIIGLDECDGVCGARREELANWLAQVQSQFDGLAPSVVDLNVPFEDKTLVALVFETDRRPYVVKNPMSGKAGGGPVQLEVPWREGTAVRSATRRDLLLILSPLCALPAFEARSGHASVEDVQGEHGETLFEWKLYVSLYAELRGESRATIPFHRCRAQLQICGLKCPVQLRRVHLQPSRPPLGQEYLGISSSALPISATADELMVSGAGRFLLSAKTTVTPQQFDQGSEVVARLWLAVAGTDETVAIEVSLPSAPPEGRHIADWELP